MEKEQISDIPAIGDKKDETSFGKFNSAEELLKAYTALEGEFTKRSQKIKELEAEKAKSAEQNEVKELYAKYPVAEKYADEVSEEMAKSDFSEKNFESALIQVLAKKVKSPDEMARDEKVITRVLSEQENRKAVIAGYLDRIRENTSPMALPKGGAIPMAPVYRPKNIREAGEIAKKILERI